MCVNVDVSQDKRRGVSVLTHITELIHLFLTPCDNNVPHCGLDDIEGADVSYLEAVLLAEPHPTIPKLVAPLLRWESKHLPGFGTAH